MGRFADPFLNFVRFLKLIGDSRWYISYMSVSNIPESIVTGITTLIVGVVGSWVVYKKQANDQQLSLEGRLNDSLLKFQDRIEDEIKQAKQENEQLRTKVRDLEHKVSELLRINENILTEKLDWMQRAFVLQAKLSLYEASASVKREDVESFTQEVRDLEGSINEQDKQ